MNDFKEVNKRHPQVSIGMPVYNGAKYIREALDSLLAQTFTDFELIISDNASTDDTESICREYAAKDSRIRYMRQAENLGAAANFKFVLDEAVGEYFMWAAYDDVWDKDWIATLLPISIADQCIAFGTVQIIDSEGNQMQHPANGRNFRYAGQRLFRRLKYYLEPGFLGKTNTIYGIYPKYLLTPDVIKIIFSAKLGADMLFIYALLEKVAIKGTQKVLLYKRIHDDYTGGGIRTCSKKRNLAAKALTFFRHSLISQYQNVKDYRSLSSFFEHSIHIVLFPLTLAYTMAMEIKHYLRFVAK